MFQVGDTVVYGNNGICKVEDVGQLKLSSMTNNRIYYTLIPIYDTNGKVFVPVDNKKVFIRHAMTKEEITDLLGDLPDLEPMWIADERGREQEYKNAISSCDCRKLIQIIKTLHSRKKQREEDGKKVTMVDERYFHMAEEKLYGEMAVVLGIDKDEVGGYIQEFLEKKQDERNE
ncbi:CarD family transcriptional regulator [Konateibacter massiliensis]|uniref:CarD family transcriptional regulator n=1 Tax=Konateibacter massiliensis TaxID=2002841 RepID=UPI000C1602EB|nr:CarD family transcriptional regulator [Konateibacter massiliensis]